MTIPTICLYSSVSDKALFQRVGFYRDDLRALASFGDTVVATNRLRDIATLRPKVVVGYFYSRAIFAGILGRLLGAKVIFTGGADQISPRVQFGLRLLAHRMFAAISLVSAHKILLSCSADVTEFEKLCFGIPRLLRKVTGTPHAVHPASASPAERSVVRGEFRAFTICWMGNLGNVMRKGVDRALRLISLLRAEGIDARLDIAGTEGPGTDLVRQLSAKLGISDSVALLGVISEAEKNRRFATDSLYLQLSRYEGFGVAAAEAFLSGMIVIHSNQGGLADVVGEHGIILDYDDLEESGSEGVLQYL